MSGLALAVCIMEIYDYIYKGCICTTHVKGNPVMGLRVLLAEGGTLVCD